MIGVFKNFSDEMTTCLKIDSKMILGLFLEKIIMQKFIDL